jgi:2-polyprenyl-6-methoxyphenol hydroxylase-like FAD-dependent oxidoreductase
MLEGPEIAIVGGGIGGSALAVVLARHGLSVAVLERDARPLDRVRGEYMQPWGVAEAVQLDLLSILRDAGGFCIPRSIGYDETVMPEDAEASPRDLRAAHPIGLGSLCAGHPAMCETLSAAATAKGAVVLRCVKNIAVAAGEPPAISFEHNGRIVSWRPRLIIGADGQNSTVRRQLGFPVLHDEPHHLVGGMLVDGVPEWPQDASESGTEGHIKHYVFPQGGDKLRLYLCYGFVGRQRFTGAGRERNMLDAFRLKSLPLGEIIASRAQPIGPFHSYSNEDHWVERPIAPGVVLIGDAAGHNDPTTGQGLAITLRDVRVVSEILLAGDLRTEAFEPYVEERLERMRRLRIATRLAATLQTEFGPGASVRRARAMRRMRVEKWLSPMSALFSGPETLPKNAFEQQTIDALLADE